MTQEQQIIDYENRLVDAMLTGNIAELDQLIHESLIFNIPTGQTITKEMDIVNYSSGMLTIHSISVTNQIIKIIDTTATVANTIDLKAKYAEQNIDGKFRYLRVWKQFGKSLKIIAGSGFQI